MTISGCPRSVQRRIYDERRRTVLHDQHIRLIELDYSQFAHDRKKKLRRDPVADESCGERWRASLRGKDGYVI